MQKKSFLGNENERFPILRRDVEGLTYLAYQAEPIYTVLVLGYLTIVSAVGVSYSYITTETALQTPEFERVNRTVSCGFAQGIAFAGLGKQLSKQHHTKK